MTAKFSLNGGVVSDVARPCNILNLEMSLINEFKSCERVGLVIILVETNVEESESLVLYIQHTGTYLTDCMNTVR